MTPVDVLLQNCVTASGAAFAPPNTLGGPPRLYKIWRLPSRFNGYLPVYAQPDRHSKIIANLPCDVDDIQSSGERNTIRECVGAFWWFDRSRNCRRTRRITFQLIRWQGITGWVRARYLREAT